jgi:putative ABC transport system ATP-binding protein
VLVTHEQRLADRCQHSIKLDAGEIVADDLKSVTAADSSITKDDQ